MSWGSWLSGADASNAPLTSNFHPVTSSHPQSQLFGKLEPKDLEWTCAGGFVTETQTWYSILKDGTFATSQIIHSSVGLWYPQIQITFKLFNPKTQAKVWKSVNVSHFVCPNPAPGCDKRSIKADQFDIKFSTDAKTGDEVYSINANMDTDLQLSWSFTRPSSSSGFKLGPGPTGGYSYFGAKKDSPDGYVIHRFWPQAKSSGHIISKGQAIDAEGLGMFVHAIQGMRPNLVASKWNFANFQSEDLGGVQGIMMEFTTISDYGEAPTGEKAVVKEGEHQKREVVTVNIGSISIGGKLVTVTGSTRAGTSDGNLQGSNSTVKHLSPVLDPETSYKTPQQIEFIWQGQALSSDGKGEGEDKLVNAKVNVDLGKPYPKEEAKGLVEKVDVLAEIPYVIKKFVNYVAGTKPYIYQTVNPATLEIIIPETVEIPGAEGNELKVEGTIYEEHTFISE